jgi:hypothetical protein
MQKDDNSKHDSAKNAIGIEDSILWEHGSRLVLEKMIPFLRALSEKIDIDGTYDRARGRRKLWNELYEAAREILKTWKEMANYSRYLSDRWVWGVSIDEWIEFKNEPLQTRLHKAYVDILEDELDRCEQAEVIRQQKWWRVDIWLLDNIKTLKYRIKNAKHMELFEATEKHASIYQEEILELLLLVSQNLSQALNPAIKQKDWSENENDEEHLIKGHARKLNNIIQALNKYDISVFADIWATNEQAEYVSQCYLAVWIKDHQEDTVEAWAKKLAQEKPKSETKKEKSSKLKYIVGTWVLAILSAIAIERCSMPPQPKKWPGIDVEKLVKDIRDGQKRLNEKMALEKQKQLQEKDTKAKKTWK